MTKYTFDGRQFFYKVFLNEGSSPFILLSTTEEPSIGISRIYFLSKYSMKYAMEYFSKDVQTIENKRDQKTEVPF